MDKGVLYNSFIKTKKLTEQIYILVKASGQENEQLSFTLIYKKNAVSLATVWVSDYEIVNFPLR